MPRRSSGASIRSGVGGTGSAYDDERRAVGLLRVPGGCLFWILVSIALSVTLTIVLNLGLFALGG